MIRRSALFFAVFAIGCGSSSSGNAITDAGTDGTSDVASDVVTTETTSDTASCVDCFGVAVTWGEVGGLVAYSDSAKLDGCNGFTYTRTSAGADSGPPKSCTTTVAGCNATSGIGLAQIENAFGNPDVFDAFAHAPVLFGRDTRPTDGSVFEIVKNGEKVDVGLDCTAGDTTCTPVPAGVKALQALLQNLATQELAKDACVAVFGHPGGA